MNWFFHKVYWGGWICMHNRQKEGLDSQGRTGGHFPSAALVGFGIAWVRLILSRGFRGRAVFAELRFSIVAFVVFASACSIRRAEPKRFIRIWILRPPACGARVDFRATLFILRPWKRTLSASDSEPSNLGFSNTRPCWRTFNH